MVEISALKSHSNIEGDATLVRTKIPIFALGRIHLWYCGMDVARIRRACTGCCRCVTYHVFSICQGNSNNFEHKNASHQCWGGEEGNINIKHILSPLPTLLGCIFVLKTITVALAGTK